MAGNRHLFLTPSFQLDFEMPLQLPFSQVQLHWTQQMKTTSVQTQGAEPWKSAGNYLACGGKFASFERAWAAAAGRQRDFWVTAS